MRKATLDRLDIDGKRKAAVMVIALGPSLASEVFKHLRQDEIDDTDQPVHDWGWWMSDH